MNILSFLKGVLSLFISNFPAFVKKLFNKIPDELKLHISVIIATVNNIKAFVDSPAADFITSVIPGTADDKIKQWLRDKLPAVLDALGLFGGGVLELSDNDQAKGAQLRAIASVLTQDLTGMPADQAAITAQVVYQNS